MTPVRWVWLGFGITAALAGAVALTRGFSASTSGIERELLSQRPAVVGNAASAYSLALKTAITTDDGGVVARYQLRGQLTLAPVSSDSARHVVEATLVDASLTDVNFSDPDQRVPADFIKTFAKPCFISFDSRGQVAELKLANNASSFTQTTWKVIAGLLQTSAPEAEGQASWKAREFDAAGQYGAQYDVANGHLHKHKLAYFGPSGALAATQQVQLSDLDFSFGHGVVSALNVHEKVHAIPAQPWPAMTSEVTLELARSAQAAVATAGWRTELEAATATRLQDPATLESRRADSDRARSRNANLEQLLGGARSKDEKEKLEAYQTLVSLLRVDETVAPRVAQVVRAGDELGTWMTAALGDAGNDGCQANLASLIVDPKLDATAHLSALQALGRVETPNAGTRTLIQGLLDDTALGFQAKLSLGSLAFRLKDREPKQASEILQLLAARVRRGDTVQCLKSIGNAGSAESLPLLGEELHNRSPEVRAAAVSALRRIADPQVEALLVQVLNSGDDAQVEAAALEASRQHGISPALLAAILPLVENDRDPTTQSAAISVIGDFGPAAKSAAVERALQRVVDHTDQDQLRDIAQRVLERVRGNG
jgi:hypothetical protein